MIEIPVRLRRPVPMLFPGDSMVVVINQWNIHGPPSMGPLELAKRVLEARRP